jgi:hypothetical protein
LKEKILKIFKSFFGIKIRLGAVILACIVFAGAGWGASSYRNIRQFGGKENYAQAQKYLEVKNIIDDYYVGEA